MPTLYRRCWDFLKLAEGTLEPYLNQKIREGVGIGVDEYLKMEEYEMSPEVLKKAQMGVVIWILDQLGNDVGEELVEKEMKKLVRSDFPMELLARYLN